MTNPWMVRAGADGVHIEDFVPLTMIDMPRLRELLVERDEELDDETGRLVPLTCAYWPAATEV